MLPLPAPKSVHDSHGRETSESSPVAAGAPSLPPASAALCWPCDGAALSGGICCRSLHPPALLRSPVWSSAWKDKIHHEIRRAKRGRDAFVAPMRDLSKPKAAAGWQWVSLACSEMQTRCHQCVWLAEPAHSGARTLGSCFWSVPHSLAPCLSPSAKPGCASARWDPSQGRERDSDSTTPCPALAAPLSKPLLSREVTLAPGLSSLSDLNQTLWCTSLINNPCQTKLPTARGRNPKLKAGGKSQRSAPGWDQAQPGPVWAQGSGTSG